MALSLENYPLDYTNFKCDGKHREFFYRLKQVSFFYGSRVSQIDQIFSSSSI